VAASAKKAGGWSQGSIPIAVRRRAIDDRFEHGAAKADLTARAGADDRGTFGRKNESPREDYRVFGHGNVVERNGLHHGSKP